LAGAGGGASFAIGAAFGFGTAPGGFAAVSARTGNVLDEDACGASTTGVAGAATGAGASAAGAAGAAAAGALSGLGAWAWAEAARPRVATKKGKNERAKTITKFAWSARERLGAPTSVRGR
jgi:hypothetical protein